MESGEKREASEEERELAYHLLEASTFLWCESVCLGYHRYYIHLGGGEEGKRGRGKEGERERGRGEGRKEEWGGEGDEGALVTCTTLQLWTNTHTHTHMHTYTCTHTHTAQYLLMKLLHEFNVNLLQPIYMEQRWSEQHTHTELSHTHYHPTTMDFSLPPPSLLSPSSPMSSRGYEVEADMNPMVLQRLSQDSTLCIEILLKLRVHMLCYRLPTEGGGEEGGEEGGGRGRGRGGGRTGREASEEGSEGRADGEWSGGRGQR